MKQILAQEFIGDSNTGQWITVYTVPNNRYTYIYNITVNYVGTKHDDETFDYYIRIVRDGDVIDPNTLPTVNADQIEYETNKNMIIARPKRSYKDFPDIYKDYSLREGDSIVIKSKIRGLSISIFGEELQYDFDDLIVQLQTVNTNLTNIHNDLVNNNTRLAEIRDAINNLDCQCNCS